MKTPPYVSRFIAVALVAFGWMSSARASTLFWSSLFNDLLFDSNGQTLDGTYSFEIGTFGAFVPTYQNVDQWESNWKVFDRTFDPTPLDPNDGDPEGWNVLDQFFTATVDHDTLGHSSSPDANPSDVFAQGEKVYLWAYNSKVIVPTSEWALLTDSDFLSNNGNPWEIPDPADTLGSYDWQLADADGAIIGGVNGVQSDGGFSVTPPSFSLQTAVVPEPGSVFLLLAAAATHVIRRARHLTRRA
ncbi:MAG: PEP-CTERM sorting domain-containing protein [Verrucomicrobiaceae bacterium]